MRRPAIRRAPTWRIAVPRFLPFAAALALAAAPFTAQPEDARTAVPVTAAEREFVLGEMRELLAAVRDMIEAAAAHDLDRLARAARAAGMASHRPPPPGLRDKLPKEFRQLGFGVHTEFDVIAQDAVQLRDRDLALRRIADNMARCVACHAAYRFVPAAGNPAERRP
jgi:hypothetical protein